MEAFLFGLVLWKCLKVYGNCCCSALIRGDKNSRSIRGYDDDVDDNVCLMVHHCRSSSVHHVDDCRWDCHVSLRVNSVVCLCVVMSLKYRTVSSDNRTERYFRTHARPFVDQQRRDKARTECTITTMMMMMVSRLSMPL